MLRWLDSRTPILIRPIRADDKHLLEEGLRSMSETTVQRRFLSPKPSFSRAELRYLTEIDGWDHVALVAESPTQPARRLIGVARYVRDPEHPDSAEAAVVVADDFQRLGLGSMLVEELGQRARMRGIRRFTATMASDNVAARRLLAKLTRQVAGRRTGRGVTEFAADLAA